MSLKETYDEAEAQRRLFEDTVDAAALEKAIRGYEASSKLIEQLMLFSDNELFEDITDTEIRYLLTEYRLAQLVQERRDFSRRKEALQRARVLYISFLQRCLDYEIVPASSRTSVQAVVKQQRRPLDAAARRQDKIEQFRREQDLEKALALLEGRDDPEHLRELYSTAIELAITRSVSGLDSIESELNVLAMAPDPLTADRPRDDPNARTSASKDVTQWRLDAPRETGLLDKSGRPLRSFVITGQHDRDTLKRGVFGADHSLPTMTIDEYLEQEKLTGGIMAPANKAPEGKKPVQDNEASEEEERLEKIRWDKFTEENPKGIGNTMNRG
ncbi:TAP42-like protein [Protomyces lactucae-debilis]|uniref:TAP42-like protein n=1 Tax=Protomyces lactucae-debilis TaxID=2754530 RepID=A0A1Y2ETI3_PROLT|nr:TAP42-like protein [Protomyces lactucae-debilis]ORY74869.1 TAP42-like protein [Protomyces lactucae-debilis]